MKRIEIVLILLFTLIVITGTITHEPWRDELQIWMITRDSSNIKNLIKNLKYEPHPYVWYFIVYPFSKIFPEHPEFLKIINFIFIFFSIFLLIKFSPFPNYIKFPLVFNYFFIYEYGVISRNYAISLFLLFLYLSNYKSKSIWIKALILFLLPQVHVLNIFPLMLIFIITIYEFIKKREINIILPIFFGLVGIILSYFELFSQEGFAAVTLKGKIFTLNVKMFLRKIGNFLDAFVYIPKMGIHFWNNYFLPLNLKIILSIILLIFILFFLNKNKVFMLSYLFIFMGLLFFFSRFHPGFLRHFAYYFICFIILLWIYNLEKIKVSETKNIIIAVLFTFQAFTGLYAIYMEVKHPFSQAQNVAKWLKTTGFYRNPIIGYRDYCTSSIVALLNKPIIYAETFKEGTFIKWTDKDRWRRSLSEIIKKAREIEKKYNKKVLLIFSFYLNKETVKKFNLIKIKKFSPSIVGDESFYVFLLSDFQNNFSKNFSVFEQLMCFFYVIKR